MNQQSIKWFSLISLIALQWISVINLFPKESDMTARELEWQINAVTVFTDRAQVQRRAKIELEQGEQEVIFTALPEAIEKNSIQVSGRGKALIKDVRLESVYFTKTISARAAKLKEQKKGLEVELAKNKDLIDEAQKEKNFIEKITHKITSTEGEKEQIILDPDKWIKMVDFYRTKNNALNSEIRSIRLQSDEIKDQIKKINRELDDLGLMHSQSQNIVYILLDVAQPGSMQLDLSYIVYGPSWMPDYDLRVNSDDKSMDIVYYASVRQNTGEDWQDVQLNLSTARPQVSGRMPELSPWHLDFMNYREDYGQLKRAKEAPPPSHMNQMMEAESEAVMDHEESAPEMDYSEAAAETGATAVVFNTAGDHSIDSDNKKHKVTISRHHFPAHFRYSTVPKLSPFAYLKAKVINKSDFPYLPGETHIYLDGSFVANSSLDLVAPDQEFWTYLGIDEGIKIERKIIKKYQEPTGFNKKTKITYDYILFIQNNKKTSEEIVIWDQLPISNHKEIVVQLLKPEYNKESESLKKNEYHFFEWLSQIKPGEKLEIPFSFSVTFPADKEIFNLE